MRKIIVKLKQHSPYIHFHPEQQGATLRASEIKPRLDWYILEKVGKRVKKEWLLDETNGKDALNYKLKIRNKGRSFSYKNKIINAEKEMLFYEKPELTFLIWNSELCEEICTYIEAFFIIHNLGFRQSKGYGSFTVDSIFEGNKPKEIIKKSVEDRKKILSEFYYFKILYGHFYKDNLTSFPPVCYKKMNFKTKQTLSISKILNLRFLIIFLYYSSLHLLI